jgi:hypothetical protein
MKQGSICTILITLLLGFAIGCTKQPTRVDTFHGTAFELARANQIGNQDAGIHTGAPVGLDGVVGAKVITRYEKGFDKPAPITKSYTINVGN